MKDKIIFVGDIHGKFDKLRYMITQYGIDNAYIIQVGDFGAGYYKEGYYVTAFAKLNESLKKHNNELIVIRGNHDNPSYFAKTNNPFGYEAITLLQDYSELEILGKKFLFVGGAVSIDRSKNIEGETYWEDEVFVLNHDFNYGKYDVVVTHTRPGKCGALKGFGAIQHWIWEDPDLESDLIDESNCLDVLYERTKPPHWFYGHFHKSDLTRYEDTDFRCLNIDEFYLYEHQTESN